MTQDLLCSACGAFVSTTDRLCSSCGAPIAEGASPTELDAPPLPGDQAEPLPSAPAAVATPSAQPPADSAVLAKFPIWQAVLLNILSFGLWGLYWVYRVRLGQCHYLVREDDAKRQAFGSIIPIWNCIVVRNLWREADEIISRAGARRIGYRTFTSIFIVLYATKVVFGTTALGIIGTAPAGETFILILYATSIVFAFAALGIPVLYVIVQSRLNNALDTLSGGVAPTMRFTFWAFFWFALPLIVFGGLIAFIIAIAATFAGV
jgi:hypothetical protein